MTKYLKNRKCFVLLQTAKYVQQTSDMTTQMNTLYTPPPPQPQGLYLRISVQTEVLNICVSVVPRVYCSSQMVFQAREGRPNLVLKASVCLQVCPKAPQQLNKLVMMIIALGKSESLR